MTLSLGPLLSVIAGILVLVSPAHMSLIVGVYLIVSGLLGFGLFR